MEMITNLKCSRLSDKFSLSVPLETQREQFGEFECKITFKRPIGLWLKRFAEHDRTEGDAVFFFVPSAPLAPKVWWLTSFAAAWISFLVTDDDITVKINHSVICDPTKRHKLKALRVCQSVGVIGPVINRATGKDKNNSVD